MRKVFTLLLVSSIFVSASAQRVLGYFPDYRSESSIQYDKLTDIAFSFLNPNPNGTLAIPGGGNLFSFNTNLFQVVKSKSNANGVNLWIAVGGADNGEQRAARLEQVSANANTRATFVNALVQFSVDNSLFGIVMDWEFPKTVAARQAIDDLMRDLDAAVAASARPTMKLAMAVGGETKGFFTHTQFINTSTFQYVDEFHIMAYDFPAGRADYDALNHSSLNDAMASLDGWRSKGIPYNKMLLALPFYGRQGNARGNVLEYNRMFGNDQTIFLNDSHQGFYYNGKNTLEQKIQGAVDKGAIGVIIWELGHDKSGQYSLLNVVKSKIDQTCSTPVPNLGADKGICGDVNETLNSGLSSTSGIDVKWYRNDQLISGANVTTYTATQNGIYRIEVTKDGCTRESTMEIVSGSEISATGGTGCAGDDITLSVNNPDNSITYEWYADATGGSSIGSGASLAVSPNVTTSYYVEEQSSSQNYDLGRLTLEGLGKKPWAWTQKLGEVAHMINAEQTITIQNVTIKIGGKGTAKIVILDEFGTRVDSSESVSYETGTQIHQNGGEDWLAEDLTIPSNITLSSGSYFVVITGVDAGERVTYNRWSDNQPVTIGTRVYLERYICNSSENGSAPPCTDREIPSVKAEIFGEEVEAYIEDGVVSMEAIALLAWYDASVQEPGPNQTSAIDKSRLLQYRSLPANQKESVYGVLFDWKISSGAASSCPRAEAVAIVEECIPLDIEIVSPANNSTHSTNEMTIDVTVTGEVQNVSYTISPQGGSDIIVSGQQSNGFDLDYIFESSGTYTITVLASNEDEEAEDQITIVLDLLSTAKSLNEIGASVYPNPFVSGFTLDAGNKVTGSYTVTLSDVNGNVVMNETTSTKKLAIGQDLESGVYTLQFVTEGKVFTTKVVKQ